MKPRIAITLNKSPSTSDNYVKTIEEFGGVPNILLPEITSPYEYDKNFNGILLTGGKDIHPKMYNQEIRQKLTRTDEIRDAFEIHLYNHCISNEIPILGICRGIQIMNVAAGGNLYQDINIEFPRVVSPQEKESCHSIQIFRGTLLNRILNRELAKVNSAHHQAIKNLGNNLCISARTIEGLIEAIEHLHHPFALGVQYHPERMTQYPEHRRKIFKAFIQAAIKRSKLKCQ